MMRLWILIAAAVCLGGMTTPSFANGDCDELRGDELTLPGETLAYPGSAWKLRGLPSKGDVDDALARLDASDGLPLVYSVDLSGDHRAELLLTTPDGRLCGNAGCPHVLLASGSMKRIGEFFGHLAILDARINGYRVIQSYSRYRVGMSSLDTYVFERGAYRLVSHVLVESCGLEQWNRRMRAPK